MKGMKKVTPYVAALTLALTTGVVGEAQAADPMDAVANHIAIVNDYAAPIRVLAEDSDGDLREVAVVKPGEVQLIEAPTGDADGAGLRLHARPTNSTDRLSTWGDIGITTEPLELAENETAILWVARDLTASTVEIRAG